MEYDIIEQMMELALANIKLELKLVQAAKLLLDSFSFDQCAIYLWDGKKREFVLKAHQGSDLNLLDTYREGEGVPGVLCIGKKGVVEVSKAPSDTAWEGVADRGLKGFGSAFVCPLRHRADLYGALYCKGAKRSLTEIEKHTLAMAALQIVSVLKCAELAESHEKIHGELVEVQSKLINAEKLMALGDMAATLAHDIRNPLISIGGFALRLKKHLEQDSPGHPYVDQMVKEISRIEKMMNGMIRFLKDSAVELQPDDLNEILEDALGLFDEEITLHNINVIKDYDTKPLPVMADREQLKIAFDNLIANAIQSMAKREEGKGPRTMTLSTGISGGFIYARVSDNGGGIDPRHIAFIFNPFFTTKKYGTGLGLPITNSIVMRHKGVIEIDNHAGVGVAFTVKLPYAEKKAQ